MHVGVDWWERCVNMCWGMCCGGFVVIVINCVMIIVIVLISIVIIGLIGVIGVIVIGVIVWFSFPLIITVR